MCTKIEMLSQFEQKVSRKRNERGERNEENRIYCQKWKKLFSYLTLESLPGH